MRKFINHSKLLLINFIVWHQIEAKIGMVCITAVEVAEKARKKDDIKIQEYIIRNPKILKLRKFFLYHKMPL